jgi:hypothetical protein
MVGGSFGINGDQNDNHTSQAGAAYLFVRTGTTWNQQAYLKASNTEGEDFFGFSAVVSGDTVVVGAYQEDSNATGVNGNQSDNSASASGAAYVFTGLGIGPTLAILPDSSGGYFIRFAGHAGFSYRLQGTANVDQRGPWPTLATQTAPPSGLVEFRNLLPSFGKAFYRVVTP